MSLESVTNNEKVLGKQLAISLTNVNKNGETYIRGVNQTYYQLL